MINKIDNLKEMQYLANIELLGRLLLDANKKKPSEKLEEMINAVTEIAFYVNGLKLDKWGYDTAMKEYRSDRNRAIERARRAEKKLEELEKKLKINLDY